jgi:hypothetical protein
MKPIAVALCAAAVALSFAAHAQPKPDFSGTWAMDVQRSVSPTYPELGGPVTLVIRQSETDLTIETRRGGRSATVIYTSSSPAGARLAGAPSPGPSAPASRWYWDGERLVTETVRLASDSAEGTYRTKEVRTLASSGQEMIVETTLVVEHGYTLRGTRNHETGKDIYRKVGREE